MKTCKECKYFKTLGADDARIFGSKNKCDHHRFANRHPVNIEDDEACNHFHFYKY